MRFSTVFAATALAGSSLAVDHKVVVGNGGANGNLTFSPNVTEAAEGDTVTFHFWPKSHSVAQSAFASPCEPLEGGFWSGYIKTNDTSAASNTTFMYTVQNASAPVWFYCTFMQHCQGGMVGVINPPKTGNRTIAAYKKAAENATANVEPTSNPADKPGNGMVMNAGETMNGTKGNSAASVSVNSGVVFTFMGLMAYFLL